MAEKEKSCGAVVVRQTHEQTEILLIRHNAGHWAFPKGHIEAGETETQTAAREILEETGLTVDIDDGFRMVITYSPKPGVEKDVVYFIGRNPKGTPRPQLTEVSRVEWVPLERAAERVTFANDRQVLLQAASYLNGRP